MKPIKFNLPINGIKAHNLEELRDNFTTEILEHHASGLLLKWLKSRNLTTEAGRLSAITSHQNDAATLAALCKIFGIDADRAERELLREQMGETWDLLQESLQELALLRISLGTTTNNDPATEPTPDRSASGRRVIPAHFANASLDADQSVIEVATSKGQTDQVVTFHEYPDEMQGKKSELSDYLGDGKLYLSQDDYKLFVKTKVRIEQKGMVGIVAFCKETYESGSNITYQIRESREEAMPMCELDFSPLKNLGDVIEVGDIIGNVKLRKHYTMRLPKQSENYAILAIETSGQIKSPLRGVLVKLGGNTQQASTYRIGDPLCFIKIDHDAAPTIKIISD